MRILKYGAVLLFFVSLWGCSSGNGSSVVLEASGKHAANWVINHGSFCRALPGVVDDPAAVISRACSECHGDLANSNSTGGNVRVSCFTPSIDGTLCHATNPLAKPTGCIICHGNPPATGGHPGHFESIPNLSCSTSCHFNLGSGSAKHANINVTDIVVLSPTFQAKTGGTALFNLNDSCSFVSCHGGQPSPQWPTGSINVDTDCNLCHRSRTDSDQYNSYFTGIYNNLNGFGPFNSLHDFHLTIVTNGVCTACHNTTNLAVNHFTHLETQVMEGPTSATIGGGATSITTYVPGSVSGSGSCTPSPTSPCHGTRTW